MIRAVIVEDEKLAADALASLLVSWCPDIKLEAVSYSGADALIMLEKIQPDLVFLDIEMPHMNGFELLTKMNNFSFEVIFTTGYDQYAIKAIKISALDYLLKPVDRQELMTAVSKINTRKRSDSRQFELSKPRKEELLKQLTARNK